MTEQLLREHAVSLEDLVVSHSYEMLALVTVLERKGVLTRGEVLAVIRELQGSGSGE